MTNLAEYQNRDHALRYLNERADAIPHRTEGEAELLDLIPLGVERVLDLGTGDGRLASLLLIERPHIRVVATDFSPTMVDHARARFSDDDRVEVVPHDFSDSIAEFGRFDAIVSSFAIHHVEDDRKRSLYKEIFEALLPGGVFANLEHVSSPTARLHDEFLAKLGVTRGTEDQSNRCISVETQLAWLREIGFRDVDCYWKWRELALLGGVKG